MSRLLELAEQGDQETIQLFSTIGENIGIGISSLIHVINPELIVIGGKMTECQKWIHPSLVQTIEKRAKLFYQSNFQLEYSSLGMIALFSEQHQSVFLNYLPSQELQLTNRLSGATRMEYVGIKIVFIGGGA